MERVLLQVEHKVLRSLTKQQSFTENIVQGFRYYNQHRLEQLSTKIMKPTVQTILVKIVSK